MPEYPRLGVVPTSPHRYFAEAVASASTPLGRGEGPGREGLRRGEEKMSTDRLTKARNAYLKTVAQAQKAYGAAVSQARKAYDEAMAPAHKAYEEAVAPGPQGLP